MYDKDKMACVERTERHYAENMRDAAVRPTAPPVGPSLGDIAAAIVDAHGFLDRLEGAVSGGGNTKNGEGAGAPRGDFQSMQEVAFGCANRLRHLVGRLDTLSSNLGV